MPRVSKELRQALELIATKGLTQAAAAEQVGISKEHLCRALKKPHVDAALTEAKQAFALEIDNVKADAKRLAIAVGIDLMQNAKSENVRARMVEFFAGEDRRGPSVTVNTAVNVGGKGYEFAPYGADIVEINPAENAEDK